MRKIEQLLLHDAAVQLFAEVGWARATAAHSEEITIDDQLVEWINASRLFGRQLPPETRLLTRYYTVVTDDYEEGATLSAQGEVVNGMLNVELEISTPTDNWTEHITTMVVSPSGGKTNFTAAAYAAHALAMPVRLSWRAFLYTRAHLRHRAQSKRPGPSYRSTALH